MYGSLSLNCSQDKIQFFIKCRTLSQLRALNSVKITGDLGYFRFWLPNLWCLKEDIFLKSIKNQALLATWRCSLFCTESSRQLRREVSVSGCLSVQAMEGVIEDVMEGRGLGTEKRVGHWHLWYWCSVQGRLTAWEKWGFVSVSHRTKKTVPVPSTS